MKNLISAIFFSLIFFTGVYAQVIDNFSDGDFTTNPTWSGDDGKFIVNSSLQLQLFTTGSDVAYLSTNINSNEDTVKWQFYIKLSFDPSSTNFPKFYLMSNNADLKGSLNGYFISFGETGSLDAIALYRQSGMSVTEIARGIDGEAAFAPELRIAVLKNNLTGEWNIFADNTGGTNFHYEASVIDTTYEFGVFYIGPVCTYTSSNSQNFFFDDFYVGNDCLPTNSTIYKSVCNNYNFNGTVLSSSGLYHDTLINAVGCDSIITLHLTINSAFQEKICLVTVDTITWKNKIMWEKTSNVGSVSFNIYKETSFNIYDSIGNIPYDSASFFIDYTSVPESHGDKYKISVMDTCYNESLKCPYHKTINLVISTFGSTMGLSWTPYEDEGGVFVPGKYYIFRGTQPDNMQLLDSITASFTSYNDNNILALI